MLCKGANLREIDFVVLGTCLRGVQNPSGIAVLVSRFTLLTLVSKACAGVRGGYEALLGGGRTRDCAFLEVQEW
ncbi:hypothetical protein VNO80_01345 [Phaseolus coccineus]|uniref:Uncharacterized protein n=1 Tax=Phaseolus coccineus TaxID=3886 RepID=A0AAN9RSQ6_PHACN